VKFSIYFVVSITSWCIVGTAAGQVQSYHHRSTVLGDYLAGQAELTLAQGIRSYYWARAYEAHTRAERQRIDVAYQAAWNRQSLYEKHLQRLQAKREANQRRRDRRNAALAADADLLARNVAAGKEVWPMALRSPEFADAIRKITWILNDRERNGGRNSFSGDPALEEIVAELQRQLMAQRATLARVDRIRAQRTIQLLVYLASQPEEKGALVAGARLSDLTSGGMLR
jgi:hypothetical protein